VAVLVEALSVIVKRASIDAIWSGGWQGFERVVPNSTLSADPHLVRVGFMTPTDVLAFIALLEDGGLVHQHDYSRIADAVDVVVVDQFAGPTTPAPWLQIMKVPHGDGMIVAASLVGQPVSDVVLPRNWKFDPTLHFVSEGFDVLDGLEGLQFLRHERGTDVYWDPAANCERYVGRPVVAGDSQEAIHSQLRQIYYRVLELRGAEAEEDERDAEPRSWNVLVNDCLRPAARLAQGPGNAISMAHLVHGMVLRDLRRYRGAAAEFKRAVELDSMNVGAYREWFCCLSELNEPQEALRIAQRGREVAPADVGIVGNLAVALFKCGRLSEARECIDQALALDPRDEINHAIHAMIHGGDGL
jgi:Tetratricopeptide repeat